MKFFKKFLSLLIVICFVMTAFTSIATSTNSTNFKDLHLTVLGKMQTGSKVAVKDVLTPIWRSKTHVIPEIITIPPGVDYIQWMQMQIVAGTFPQIIAVTNGIFDNPQCYDFLKKQKILREIKLSDMKKNMPLTAKLYKKYGITIDDWYSANVDPRDGKLWYIPSAPSILLSKQLRNEKVGQEQLGVSMYYMYFRDDILKKIFPKAKSEAELNALYFKKGYLTFEDITADVPIKNLNDLYNYLKKVKQLNLKVGNRPVIPAHPMFMKDAGALMWSMFTGAGFWWQELGDRLTTDYSLKYFAATPEWKEYIRWYNKCYNEDLLGKEIFIQTDDQRNSKVINGEYAVFQGWLPAQEARNKAKQEKRGYGFRLVPIFPMPLVTKYQNNTEFIVSMGSNWGAIGITKNVKDADIPQILHWIDWNYSEEAAELRAWGPREFSTGEGKNRRFKPEYKELEQYLLTGKLGEKDGAYYGMTIGGDQIWNHEVYGIGNPMPYPWAPKYVYPETKDTVNIDDKIRAAVNQYYTKQMKFYRLTRLGSDVQKARAEFDKLVEEFGKLKRTTSFDCDGAKNATIRAIVGKPQDFDKNYDEGYYKRFITKQFMDNIEKQEKAWAKYRALLKKYKVPLR